MAYDLVDRAGKKFFYEKKLYSTWKNILRNCLPRNAIWRDHTKNRYIKYNTISTCSHKKSEIIKLKATIEKRNKYVEIILNI